MTTMIQGKSRFSCRASAKVRVGGHALGRSRQTRPQDDESTSSVRETRSTAFEDGHRRTRNSVDGGGLMTTMTVTCPTEDGDIAEK